MPTAYIMPSEAIASYFPQPKLCIHQKKKVLCTPKHTPANAFIKYEIIKNNFATNMKINGFITYESGL